MTLTYSEAKALVGWCREQGYDPTQMPKAMRRALHEGGDWENRNHTWDHCTIFVSPDDGWHTFGYTYDLRIAGGKPEVYDLTCDSGGDWDTGGSAAPPGTPEARAIEEAAAYEQSIPGWRDYWMYMAEYGLDPVSEVTRSRSRTDLQAFARRELLTMYKVPEADLPQPHPEDCDCEVCAPLTEDEQHAWYEELNRGYNADRI